VSARRTLIILVAIGIAAVAAVSNVLYLNSVQDRANNHAKLQKVFVVTRDIPKGTPGETALGQSLVKSSAIPAQFRPTTALTDLNVLKGKVSLTKLAAGQVLVDGQFVEPKAAQVTFSQRIPPGMVAISISVDGIKSVGGLLVPGDRVDMLVQVKSTKPPVPAPGPIVQPADPSVEEVLYQNVQILAIGTSAAPQAGDTAAAVNPGSGTFTFALPIEAAQRLVLAQTAGGGVYLTLVPPDNKPQATPPIPATELIPPNGKLTPYPDQP
jgi:pilus assembly protein CpaB